MFHIAIIHPTTIDRQRRISKENFLSDIAAPSSWCPSSRPSLCSISPRQMEKKWRMNLTCQNIYPLFWELTSNESKRTWMILIHCNNGEPVLMVLNSINIWNDRFSARPSIPFSQILRETHTHAPTTHSKMYNEISSSLYLGAAVPMINVPLPGKLCCWRKTRREQDTWNISLGPFLIIIIIIISTLLPYLSC